MLTSLVRTALSRSQTGTLPVVPFERYMLVDERPGWPMTFFMEVDLVGTLDRAALEEAFRVAVAEQPLLTARLERSVWGAMRWRPETFAAAPLLWLPDLPDGTAPLTGLVVKDASIRPTSLAASSSDRAVWWGPAPDPRTGASVRLAGQSCGSRHRLVFELHHAVVDGVGALEFAGRIFGHYVAVVTGQNGQGGASGAMLRPLDGSRLTRRDRPTIELPAPVSAATVAAAMLREGRTMLLDRVTPLVCDAHSLSSSCPSDRSLTENEIGFPGFQSVRLDRDCYRAMRKRAASAGVSGNDWLLASLLTTLRRKTNRDASPASAAGNNPSGRTRAAASSPRHVITMPVNLRDRGDEWTPACNKIGYVFVSDRQPPGLPRDAGLPGGVAVPPAKTADSEIEALARIVRQQTDFALTWGTAALFTEGVRAVDRVPGALRAATRWKSCYATAVLSNVGEISRRFGAGVRRDRGRVFAADLEIVALRGTPPARPGTPLAILASTMEGELFLTARPAPGLPGPVLSQLLADVQNTLTEDL